MARGRKPKPAALRHLTGNPGKRPLGANPMPPGDLPTCPAHLSPTARAEWKRLARTLNRIGLLSAVDRAALAGYCQAYGRWVEAERQLAVTPTLLKTPSGYVQPSPWLAIANKNAELMHRWMGELGMTPSSRSRVTIVDRLRPKPWEFTGEIDDGCPGDIEVTFVPAGDVEDAVEDAVEMPDDLPIDPDEVP